MYPLHAFSQASMPVRFLLLTPLYLFFDVHHIKSKDQFHKGITLVNIKNCKTKSFHCFFVCLCYLGSILIVTCMAMERLTPLTLATVLPTSSLHSYIHPSIIYSYILIEDFQVLLRPMLSGMTWCLFLRRTV